MSNTPNNPQRDERTNGGKPHVCGEIAVHNTPTKGDIWLCNDCNLPVDSPDFSSPKSEVSGEWEKWLRKEWREYTQRSECDDHNVISCIDDAESYWISKLLSQREHDREEMRKKVEGMKGINRMTKDEALDTILALLK